MPRAEKTEAAIRIQKHFRLRLGPVDEAHDKKNKVCFFFLLLSPAFAQDWSVERYPFDAERYEPNDNGNIYGLDPFGGSLTTADDASQAETSAAPKFLRPVGIAAMALEDFQSVGLKLPKGSRGIRLGDDQLLLRTTPQGHEHYKDIIAAGIPHRLLTLNLAFGET